MTEGAGLGPNKRWYLERFDPPKEAPFPVEEYRERWSRTRAAMQEAGVDCLIASTPESMCYLTGYAAEWYQGNGPRDWVPGSCVALHVDHDEPIQFDDPEEVTLIRFTSVASDVRIGPGLGWEMLDFVVGELAALGWLRGTVGVERRTARRARRTAPSCGWGPVRRMRPRARRGRRTRMRGTLRRRVPSGRRTSRRPASSCPRRRTAGGRSAGSGRPGRTRRSGRSAPQGVPGAGAGRRTT